MTMENTIGSESAMCANCFNQCYLRDDDLDVVIIKSEGTVMSTPGPAIHEISIDIDQEKPESEGSVKILTIERALNTIYNFNIFDKVQLNVDNSILSSSSLANCKEVVVCENCASVLKDLCRLHYKFKQLRDERSLVNQNIVRLAANICQLQDKVNNSNSSTNSFTTSLFSPVSVNSINNFNEDCESVGTVIRVEMDQDTLESKYFDESEENISNSLSNYSQDEDQKETEIVLCPEIGFYTNNMRLQTDGMEPGNLFPTNMDQQLNCNFGTNNSISQQSDSLAISTWVGIKFKCSEPTCGKSFVCTKDLETHVKIHDHDDRLVNQEKIVQVAADKINQTLSKFKSSVSTRTNNRFKVYPSTVNFIPQTRVYNTCPMCPQGTFPTSIPKDVLCDHWFDQHRSSAGDKLVCPLCGLTWKNEQSFKYHLKTHVCGGSKNKI